MSTKDAAHPPAVAISDQDVVEAMPVLVRRDIAQPHPLAGDPRSGDPAGGDRLRGHGPADLCRLPRTERGHGQRARVGRTDAELRQCVGGAAASRTSPWLLGWIPS